MLGAVGVAEVYGFDPQEGAPFAWTEGTRGLRHTGRARHTKPLLPSCFIVVVVMSFSARSVLRVEGARGKGTRRKRIEDDVVAQNGRGKMRRNARSFIMHNLELMISVVFDKCRCILLSFVYIV